MRTQTHLGAVVLGLLVGLQPSGRAVGGQSTSGDPWNAVLHLQGQSSTLLPDGTGLLLGGEGVNGPVALAAILDQRTRHVKLLPHSLNHERAWHTATLLGDGTVLVMGGVDKTGNLVDSVELLRPDTLEFQILPGAGLSPRAYHTATLLIDGRVLIVGGLSAEGETLQDAELWDPRTATVAPLPAQLSSPRRSRSASLLVRWDRAALGWNRTRWSDTQRWGDLRPRHPEFHSRGQ